MAYNKNNQPEDNEGSKELWQRQIAILEALTEAEKVVYQGMDLQNPAYDVQFGSKRNLVSVSTMLRGAERMLFIIAPLIKDNKEDGGGKGINSKKYNLFKEVLGVAQANINSAVSAGVQTPIGASKLGKAYNIIQEVLLAIRQETNDLGLDFRSKPDVHEAWKE